MCTISAHKSYNIQQSHMDAKGSRKPDAEDNMAKFVNKMIKDIKAAHQSRENQLSSAAQSYKNRLEKVVRRHEELLCAYREVRSQLEASGLDEIDLGPDEHELVISDAELQSSQQKEILRLQSELHSLKMGKKVSVTKDLP